MTTESSTERAELIARKVLAVIRDFNAQGKGIGIDEISKLIQSDPDMSDILIPSTQLAKYQKNELSRQKKECDKLKDNLQKSLAKRRALVVQADTADRRAVQTREFMLRAFLALMPYFDPGANRRVKNTFSRIRDLMKQKAPIQELDAAFQQLKDDSLMEEIEVPDEPAPAEPEKPSGFALFKRIDGEQENPKGKIKGRYLKIIDEMKAVLDPIGLREIGKIEQRLRTALDSYDLMDTQKELRKLLKSYVKRVGIEREEVAGFILEIGGRLSELEQKLVACTASLRETGEAGSRFTTAIEEEMLHIQDAVGVSENLDGLKSRVIGSIDMIRKAIETKREDEWEYAQQTEEQMAQLTEKIKRMKLEIASSKKRTRRLETEILHDPLTGTNSRRAYELRIEKEFKEHQQEKRHLSLLLLDVDSFRHINERYGHDVGDICLKGMVQKIQPLLGKADFLARFEGNSFVIILPGTHMPDAQRFAEKIRAHIEKTNFLHKKEQVGVTLSIGVAETSPGDRSAGDFFGRAEKALFSAKEAGQNRVTTA